MSRQAFWKFEIFLEARNKLFCHLVWENLNRYLSWSRFLSRFLRLSSLMVIDKIHQDLLRNLSIIKTCWKTSGSKVSTNLEISTKLKGKIEYWLIEIKNNWKFWKILKNLEKSRSRFNDCRDKHFEDQDHCFLILKGIFELFGHQL